MLRDRLDTSAELQPIRLILKTGGSILVVLALLAYMGFQARYLLQGPALTLEELPVVHNERIITLSGTTRNISRITLNGRQIFTNEAGEFQEALVLENGYTVATLTAYDRYGRSTDIARPFVYRPVTFIPEDNI